MMKIDEKLDNDRMDRQQQDGVPMNDKRST
mgnify:CR=1 FL=1